MYTVIKYAHRWAVVFMKGNVTWPEFAKPRLYRNYADAYQCAHYLNTGYSP
jgi:hypothetical protein